MSGLMAFLAALGFAILFNVPKDKLIWAGIVGGIGGLCNQLLIDYGTSSLFALFIASLIIALLSELLARHLKCPTTLILISSLTPLVPGGTMYYTMLAFVQNDLQSALDYGISALVQACAIVIAVTLIASAFQTYTAFHKH